MSSYVSKTVNVKPNSLNRRYEKARKAQAAMSRSGFIHLFGCGLAWIQMTRGSLLLVILQRLSHHTKIMTYRLRTITWLNTCSVKQKADSRQSLALTFAKSVHELRKLSGTLYLEENLIVVIGDFDVEVFGLWLLVARWRVVLIRHIVV